MARDDATEEAIEVLQQLGLKEYEARCFVGLVRLSAGTAKQLSEVTEVPRTRVYDAVRVLEAQGLVEVQHTNPQQFRAVTLEEAVATLRDRYESRVESLRSSLDAIGTVENPETAPAQEVWSISDSTAVENRAGRLVDDADDEVVLIVGDGRVLTDDLVETLSDLDPWIDLLVGVVDTALREQIDDALPRASTFVSGLEWLESNGGEPSVGRLMLVDRSSILVSSIVPSGTEHAVYGTGFGNGLLVISRRLLAQGLLPRRDPADE